ncbi:MAG: hypothetical protein K6G67_03860 [Lachnospiraceae bacterium]|nr:hypothetical protein [Lachnospiraceae bacterium]
MDSYNIGKAAGLATGIIIGLVCCVFVLKYMNKDKKLLTKYDERQQAARGRAYMYGFWAVMIATASVIVAETAGFFPVAAFTRGFFIIFVGVIVQVSYSIFNDAYYGINTNKKRFMIVCIIAGLCNLLGVIGSIKGGNFIEDGVMTDAGSNLLCVIMMFTIAVELLIKDRIDSAKVIDEESED